MGMVKITNGNGKDVVDTDTDDITTDTEEETEPDTTDTEPETAPVAVIIASARDTESGDTALNIEPATPPPLDNQSEIGSEGGLITLLAQVTEHNQELKLALEGKEQAEYNSTVWCTEQVAELTQKFRSIGTNERLVHEELKRTREQLSQSEQTIAELQNRMSEQAETLRLTNVAVETAETRERLAQEELERIREQFRQSQQTITALQGRASQQTETLRLTNAAVETVKTRERAAQEELVRIRDQFRQSQHTIAELQGTTETLTVTNAAVATRERLVQEALVQSRVQIGQSEQTITGLQQRLVALQEQWSTSVAAQAQNISPPVEPVVIVVSQPVQPIENAQALQTLALLQSRIALTNKLRRH